MRLGAVIAFTLCCSSAFAQNALLQSGPVTRGHVPQYSNNGTGQPIVLDGGPAAGGMLGVNPAEFGLQAPAHPTGPMQSNFCDYDAPINSATGYHYLCLSPNFNGQEGVIAYGYGGTASPLPLDFYINGQLVVGVSCAANTVSLTTLTITNGIVTHC